MSISNGKLQSRRPNGFTLLEVLVALSIMAISFGVLMQIFGDVSRAATLSGNYRQAVMVAESQLALASADPALRAIGSSGYVDDRFRCAINAVRFDQGLSAAGTRFENVPSLVTVEVSWSEGERSRSISLGTIVLGVTARQRR